MTPVPESPRWRLAVATTLAGVAAALGLLAAGEGAARLLDPPDRTLTSTLNYQAWAQGPCYRVDHGRLLRLRPQGQEIQGEDPSGSFALEKAEGVRRVVVVGESTGEMVEREMAALAARPGCQRVEVLACSAAGSLPEVAVHRAEEVMAYSPDVIVVALGHNFLLPAPAKQPLGRASRSRLGHELDRILRLQEEPPTPAQSFGDDVRDPPKMGREAYQAILKSARNHGVEVVAVSLASNLWFRPNVDPEYLVSPERAKGWVRWGRGDSEGAVAALTPSGMPDNALQAFERARFRADGGDWKAARSELEKARDLEQGSTRASSATTAAILSAAREGGARIINADALFSGLAEHGIPGWDVFLDNCHPRGAALEVLARAVLAAAAPGAAAACVAPRASAAGGQPTAEARFDYGQLTMGPGALRPPGRSQLDDRAPAVSRVDMRRLVDGPIGGLVALAPGEVRSMLDRYDREILGATETRVHAAMLGAIGASLRDAQRLDLARLFLDRSMDLAPVASTGVDLALVLLRSHEDAAARALLERTLSLDSASPYPRRLLEALNADDRRGPTAGK